MLFSFPFYNNLIKEEKLNCKMFIRFQIIISLQDLCLIVFALKNIEIYGCTQNMRHQRLFLLKVFNDCFTAKVKSKQTHFVQKLV